MIDKVTIRVLAHCCKGLPKLTWLVSGLSGSEKLARTCLSAKNPSERLVQVGEDANSFFSKDLTKYHEHSGESKCQVVVYQDCPVRIGIENGSLG